MFLAYTSCSWYSTWCCVIFLLKTNCFSYRVQYLVHDRAQDVWWISFSRTNVSYTLHVPVFQHALVLDVCWISFLLYFSRKQCNFIVTAQHMMFCKFPSWEQSFLAFTAISSSRYSTSCLLNLLLVNKSFLAYFVFMLQHMMFVEFPSLDYMFLTYTALQLHIHGAAHGVCWNFFHMHAVLCEPHHRLPS